MDWKYKHFKHEAIFNAPRERGLEAARAAVAESLESIADTADGFIARGYSAWHAAIATIHVVPATAGTQVVVELLVERSAVRGYMLFDVGGYYSGQIDKWFTGISQRLASAQEQILVSKTTSNVKFQRGCVTGCLAYLVVGACLGLAAIPLDRALEPRFAGSFPGPFASIASGLALVAGIAVFLYALYPDAPAAKAIRARLQKAPRGQRER